jgi:stage V sporulation protein B
MLGTVFGEIASLLFLHYGYHKVKKTIYMPRVLHPIKCSNNILNSITAIALPITATRLINSLLNGANSILIPQRLVLSGMLREEAVGVFGIMFGMVMPLMFLPFTFTSALSVVIIPNLSEYLALKNWKEIHDKVSKAIMITCLTGFPAMALLASLGKPIGDALYHQPLVGVLLIPLSFTLPFHALQHTCSGILNGLGKQARAAVHYLIGSGIHLLCTYFLLPNPAIRISGIIIGFFLSSITVCLLNLITVLRTTKMSFDYLNRLVKPGFSALLMAMVSSASYKLLGMINAPVIINLLTSSVTGIFIFFLSLGALKGLPYDLIVWTNKKNV